MRLGVVTLVLAVGVLGVRSAASQDFYGVTGGVSKAVGKSNDFATEGGSVEIRWRHFNRSRSALEFVIGYTQMGLEGEVQNTVDRYEALARRKNFLAQAQGGPGNGFLVAEYGIFEAYYGGANLVVQPWKLGRLGPFLSAGAGIYNWRVPFRIKWNRTPFFGEQHSWEPIAEGGFYSGVVGEEIVDFTKQHTSPGVSAAFGSILRLSRRFSFDAQARIHLVFTSGDGDKEAAVDDQPYLDRVRFLQLNGGLNYRF